MLNEYPDLPAVVTHIELLVYEAGQLRGRKRTEKMRQADVLAREYEAHCAAGGNHEKQFKSFKC